MNRPRKSSRHLPPCVYEKHGAFWLVKARKWTRLGATLAEALTEYARRVETRQGGMDDLIEKVFAVHCKNLAYNTRMQYRIAADYFKAALTEFEPHQVKPKHVAAINLKLAATPNMANRKLAFLSIVFQKAVEWQLVDSNPCIGIKRHPEKKRTRLLTDEEWWSIHAKADKRLQVIMELQYLTGQRISDVLSIRRSQITDEGLVFGQQKTGAKLVVRWSPELRATIAAANALSGPSKAITLLRGRSGAAPQYSLIGKQFREAAEAAGVADARLNDTRARAATTAKAQGFSAQALLGHKSPAMTERYLRDRETPEVSGPSIRQSNRRRR